MKKIHIGRVPPLNRLTPLELELVGYPLGFVHNMYTPKIYTMYQNMIAFESKLIENFVCSDGKFNRFDDRKTDTVEKG